MTNRRSRCLAMLALGALAVLLGGSAWRNCPTHNEVAHLPAGLAIWERGRFDIYRVNPPLVRALAALPSFVGGARTDWSDGFEGVGARPEWAIGRAFLRANAGRWRRDYALGRWAVIP